MEDKTNGMNLFKKKKKKKLKKTVSKFQPYNRIGNHHIYVRLHKLHTYILWQQR